MTRPRYRLSASVAALRAPAAAALAVGGLLAVSALAGTSNILATDGPDPVTRLEPDQRGDSLRPPESFGEAELDQRRTSVPVAWSRSARRAPAVPVAPIAPPSKVVATVAPPADEPPPGPLSAAAISALADSGIPEVALAAYQSAAAAMSVADPSCRLDWSLLAGIGRVESHHGQFGGRHPRVDGSVHPPIVGIALDGRPGVALIADTDGGRLDFDTTYDRAVGPMQFIPGTWAGFGADGNGDGVVDPHNLYDASLAAARYLCAGPGDLSQAGDRQQALLRYNHSQAYVDLVTSIASAYSLGMVVTVPPPAMAAAADVPATPAVQPASVSPATVDPSTVESVAVDPVAVDPAAGDGASADGRPDGPGDGAVEAPAQTPDPTATRESDAAAPAAGRDGAGAGGVPAGDPTDPGGDTGGEETDDPGPACATGPAPPGSPEHPAASGPAEPDEPAGSAGPAEPPSPRQPGAPQPPQPPQPPQAPQPPDADDPADCEPTQPGG